MVTTGGYPADRNGNSGTNASRAKPYDWVLRQPTLDTYKTATVIGSSSFPNGLVADTRTYSPSPRSAQRCPATAAASTCSTRASSATS